MGRTIHDQIFHAIGESQHILIALPSRPSTDAIASSLALVSALEKKNKRVRVVCHDFLLPANHAFLPKSDTIHTTLTALKKFVITLDIRTTKVEELSYDIQDEKLNIFITPRHGSFTQNDITTSETDYVYDLIMTVDTPDLASLGKLFEDNTEFFYHCPIINIDHHAANEEYGQMNLVDMVAASTSEIVFDLLKKFGDDILDEMIATALLTGIISKTKSFQKHTITPRTLTAASHLIESGARREEIVKNLYQTKSINTLKLWGRALARLESDQQHGIVWSILGMKDFEKSHSTWHDVAGVIDELIVNAPEAKITMIVYQDSPEKVHAILDAPQTLDIKRHLADLSAEGSNDFTRVTLQTGNLQEAESELLQRLRKILSH